MTDKDLWTRLAVEALRTAITLFVLLLINQFIEALPFAGLPVFDGSVSAADLLSAVIAAVAIAVFLRSALNSRAALNELLDWLPGAGVLTGYGAGVAAALFAYTAFRSVAVPFIGEFDWVYQAFFLALTLFLLSRIALHVYGASESISRFLIKLLSPYGGQGRNPGLADDKEKKK